MALYHRLPYLYLVHEVEHHEHVISGQRGGDGGDGVGRVEPLEHRTVTATGKPEGWHKQEEAEEGEGGEATARRGNRQREGRAEVSETTICLHVWSESTCPKSVCIHQDRIR